MNLKSTLIAALSLIISVAFSACSESVELDTPAVSSNDSEAIVFRVDNSSSSISRSLPKVFHDFKVAALDGGSRYFDSPLRIFTNDNGVSWTSSSKIYWPVSRPQGWSGLTFVAYVDNNPSGNTFRLTDGTASFAAYEIEEDVHQQTELLYAVAKDIKSDSSAGCVNLWFRNALTPVCFSAQNNNPALDDVEILSIELGGVKGRATYTFPQASTSTKEGYWTMAEEAPFRSYCLSDINVKLGPCGSDGYGEIVDVSNSTRGKENNVMLLIPQTVEDGAFIKVKSRLTLKDIPGETFISEESFPISVEWNEGQVCNYHIVWSDAQTSFDITVADFNEVEISADL